MNQWLMLSLRYIILLGFLILGQSSKAAEGAVKPARQVMEPVCMPLPFQMVNNLIILPVQINGSDTMQFIFDTGLENSIICELDSNEVLDLKYAREVQIKGFGPGYPVDAIQSSGNSLRVGDITIEDQDYLIFSNNVLQLTRKMGIKIHGMLNAQAFSAYIIEIDYERQLLTIYQPNYFRKNKSLDGYTSLQMEIKDGTPLIHATILPEKATSYPVRLTLDTGAGHALILEASSLPGYALPAGSPDCYLGCGINGNIKGKMGRMWGVDLGPFHLQDVLVSFPDPQAIMPEERASGRNGSLGSEFLRRFHVILDFPARRIHIAPNTAFEEDFQYNMSGLEVLVPVPEEHRYIIGRVRPESRAESAGIRLGDEILSINGTLCNSLSLDEIYQRLLGKDGEKISLVLLREDKKLRVSFRLEKYI